MSMKVDWNIKWFIAPPMEDSPQYKRFTNPIKTKHYTIMVTGRIGMKFKMQYYRIYSRPHLRYLPRCHIKKEQSMPLPRMPLIFFSGIFEQAIVRPTSIQTAPYHS